MKKILLSGEDFKRLTKGEIIEKNGVEIALQDIGYPEMINIIQTHVFEYFKDKKQKIIENKKN